MSCKNCKEVDVMELVTKGVKEGGKACVSSMRIEYKRCTECLKKRQIKVITSIIDNGRIALSKKMV